MDEAKVLEKISFWQLAVFTESVSVYKTGRYYMGKYNIDLCEHIIILFFGSNVINGFSNRELNDLFSGGNII